MSNVCYFEIPVDDMSRAQAFYGQLFQWKFEKMSGATPESCDYWSIETGTPNEPGVAFGGIMKRQSEAHRMTQYIRVPSIDTSIQQVQAFGGTIIMPKTSVPDKGYFAICLDPEQNAFGLWQCDETAK